MRSRNKKVFLVFDMQFGSTGKGLVLGFISPKLPKRSMAISTMAPNAGHTYVHEDGTKFIHSALPIGALFNTVSDIGIGPGSALNLDNLVSEMKFASEHNFDSCGPQTVWVHESAIIVNDFLRGLEKKHVAIGSTMKGSGASLISKIDRDPRNDFRVVGQGLGIGKTCGRFDIRTISHKDWLDLIHHIYTKTNGTLLVEGSQGYSLGINSGFWPYTTFRECTPAQIISDAAIPVPLSDIHSFGVARTYPIRVANRYNSDGDMIGTSGPCYEDQKEISWNDIGVEPEKTTVTKLERRVFTFSEVQYSQACLHCHPDYVLINFMNYLKPEDTQDFILKIMKIHDRTVGQIPSWLSYGPKTSDIKSVFDFPE